MGGTITDHDFSSTVECRTACGRIRVEGEHLPQVLELSGIAGSLVIHANTLGRWAAGEMFHRSTEDRDYAARRLTQCRERLDYALKIGMSALVEVVPDRGCPLWVAAGRA